MNCTSLELVQLDATANTSDGQFVCTVQGNANISHSWHVTRSKCGHLDVVDLEASIRINAQKGRLSEYMQNSTLTMTNYSNEGFDWSVITCSTFDPWTGTNCSINLTITGMLNNRMLFLIQRVCVLLVGQKTQCPQNYIKLT